jgi:hypothetical protein
LEIAPKLSLNSLPAKLVITTWPSGARAPNKEEFQNVQIVFSPSLRGTINPNPSSLFATVERA